MTNEEKKIKQLLGNENHFQVPEGYFDTLADQIMAKIPEQETVGSETGKDITFHEPVARKVSLWQRLPLRKIAASVAVIAVVGSGVAFGLRQTAQHEGAIARVGTGQMAHMGKSVHHDAAMTGDDTEFDQMADYAMMDNQDIYASLIAEN